jgi:Helix-turn-helix.
MYIYSIISKLLEDRKIKRKDLMDAIGVSNSGLIHIMSEKGNPGSDKLEAMADFFKLPVDFFFKREVEIDYSVLLKGKDSDKKESKLAHAADATPAYDNMTAKYIAQLEGENSRLIDENKDLREMVRGFKDGSIIYVEQNKKPLDIGKSG